MKSAEHFLKFFFASQLFGIVGVILMIVVAVKRGETAFFPVFKEFLWHPVLMALSFGYLYGTSITVFRALKYMKKLHLKTLHTTIHIVAIAFAIGGLVTCFDFKNAMYLQHLTSLHGLYGIIAVILFCVQWVYSFILYLYPHEHGDLRAKAMPYHIIGGLVIYTVAMAAVLTGINSYNSKHQESGNSEAVSLNFAGFFFLIHYMLVLYMLWKEEFKREPIEADNQ